MPMQVSLLKTIQQLKYVPPSFLGCVHSCLVTTCPEWQLRGNMWLIYTSRMWHRTKHPTHHKWQSYFAYGNYVTLPSSLCGMWLEGTETSSVTLGNLSHCVTINSFKMCVWVCLFVYNSSRYFYLTANIQRWPIIYEHTSPVCDQE